MSSAVRNLPLLLAYFLYPIVMVVMRLSDYPISRLWIDIVWLFMGCFASFAILMRVYIEKKPSLTLNLILFVSALGVLVGIKWGVGWFLTDATLVPFLMELKPVVYLWVAWVWMQVFGRLKASEFVYYGAILGLILVVDFFIESAISGSIARPHGSGEINYDACLLLISLIMSIVGGYRGKVILTALIVIALMVSFSRTALAAAAVIVFIFSTIPFRMKLIWGGIACVFIIGSFLLRDLPIGDVTTMDRYWMWVAAIQMFVNDPMGFVFGFPVGGALPVIVPDNVGGLWESQSAGWGVDGVFPYNFHAFWLRLSITWGVGVLGICFIFLLWLYPSLSIVTKALCVLVLFQGLTMGLFYLSNIGVPLFLAFMREREGRRKDLTRIVRREVQN